MRMRIILITRRKVPHPLANFCLYIYPDHLPAGRFWDLDHMPDLYRKERRRKRLQQKKEHNQPPTTGGRTKPRREPHRRSHDELEEILHGNIDWSSRLSSHRMGVAYRAPVCRHGRPTQQEVRAPRGLLPLLLGSHWRLRWGVRQTWRLLTWPSLQL